MTPRNGAARSIVPARTVRKSGSVGEPHGRAPPRPGRPSRTTPALMWKPPPGGCVLAEHPERDRSRIGLAGCLIAMGHHGEARTMIKQGFAVGNSRGPFEQLMATNDSTDASLRLRKRN